MILAELFSSHYPFHDYRYDHYKSFLAFRDDEDAEVWVELKRMSTIEEEFPKLNVYRLDFARKGKQTITGDGKAVSKIFSTVIEAASVMIKKLDEQSGVEIDVLMIGAMQGGGRSSLYKKLIDRLAIKYNFKFGVDPEVKAALDKNMKMKSSGTGQSSGSRPVGDFDVYWLSHK